MRRLRTHRSTCLQKWVGDDPSRAVMELVEIHDTDSCRDPEIRDRVVHSPKARHTQHYVVKNAEEEIAFLALDLIPHADYLVLYEVFVPQSLRNMGIGSQLLREVDTFAQTRGYAKITLRPSPLAPGYSAANLAKWYKARGYQERVECPTELEKSLR